MAIYITSAIPNISYSNTFGEWVVATNNLVSDHNQLVSNNYQKSTGTLILADPTNALQSNGPVNFYSTLGVLGVGSSATIQNTLTVSQGQVLIQNTTLGLVNSGQANIGGILYATAPNTGLYVSNNTILNGYLNVSANANLLSTLSVSGNVTLSNTLSVSGNVTLSNTLSVSGNTSLSNTLYVSQNTYLSRYLTVTNDILTTNANLTGNLTVSLSATVNNSFTTNILQSNTSVNTGTLTVAGTSYANILQANTSANTGTLTVAGTTYTNILQANTSANTGTLTVSGSTYTNILQANTSVNTGTLTVAGTSYANIMQANTSMNTSSLSACTATFGVKVDANNATGYFKSISTTGQVSVGGNFVISGSTVYNSNVFTLNSGSSTGLVSQYNVNRGISGANASIRWNELNLYWDIIDVTNNNFYQIITTEQITDNLTYASSSTAASSNVANYLNNVITTNIGALNNSISSNFNTLNNSISSNVNTLNSSISSNATNLYSAISSNVNILNSSISSNVSAVFTRANTGLNSIIGTTGTAIPTTGATSSITFNSTNGVTVTGSSNTLTINTPQDLRSTASPTFTGLTLSTNPLPISSGGTGQNSAGGALTALLPTGTTSGYVLTTGGPGSFYWAAGGGGGGGGATPGTTISSTYKAYVADGSTTQYNTPVYVPGADQLKIYLDGVRQHPGQYTETSGNTSGNGIVTFASTIPSGVTVLTEVDGYIVNPYYANNIAYTINSSISPSANTIQLAIDGLTTKLTSYYANTQGPGSFATFTYPLTGVTVAAGTSNTAFATTAYVQNLANNSGTLTTNITGNAGTVTNGVYTNGSYSDPSWITSLANTKINGTFAASKITGLATSATTDTSNANNIISGTLSASRLPYTLNQNVGTSNDVQHNSLGVGTAGSGTMGEIRATNNITAYYSDDRLKTKLGNIENALEKVMSLDGFYYEESELAESLGYKKHRQVGLSAQQTQKVMPEIVVPAPIDPQYLTIHYEKMIPLLVEAIKELKMEVDALKGNNK